LLLLPGALHAVLNAAARTVAATTATARRGEPDRNTDHHLGGWWWIRCYSYVNVLDSSFGEAV
jgi:hypothetical protein